MANSKMMKTVGAVVSGVLILGVADFLTARNFAPNPLYKKRGYTPSPQSEPELPPLDLSKLKVSDTRKVLAERDAQRKQAKKTLPLNTTKGLGEALTPAAKEMYNSTTTPQTPPEQSVTSNTPPYEQTYASQKITELFSGDIGNKEFFSDPKIPDGEKRKMLRLLSPKKMEKLAKSGNAMAQNQLGLQYFRDKNDPGKALYWFMEAAKNGYNTGVTNASAMLEQKEITKPDRDKTVNWMRQQAEAGNPAAQYVYGTFYLGGLYGLTDDKKIGYAWIEKSAKNGFSTAQVKLGFARIYGGDIEKNHDSAFKLFSKAAKQGNYEGQYWLAEAYQRGIGVYADDTKAIEWYKKAHQSGNPEAALKLVFIYMDEDSHEYSFDKARDWVEYMIKNDNSAVAHVYAGDMYSDGYAYSKDNKKAYAHYLAAAEQNNGEGQYKTALALLEGRGVDKNKQLAIEWLQKADKNYSYAAGVKLKELGISAD
ncbi:MAG: sel1 repeat family protein [Robiginitomaculum sp.]|nr:sel1 repeat family protein [Robiginitomaculum sp.]